MKVREVPAADGIHCRHPEPGGLLAHQDGYPQGKAQHDGVGPYGTMAAEVSSTG